MSKNEKNIISMASIIIGIFLLFFFTYRLVSENDPENREFESSIGFIGTELDSARGSIQRSIEGVESTESGLETVIESLEQTERDNIESVETIDHNLSGHVEDSEGIITGVRELEQFDTINREGIGGARELIQELTDLIQEGILLEQG